MGPRLRGDDRSVRKMVGRPAGTPPDAPRQHQPTCKPGSVGHGSPRALRPFLCDAGCPARQATYPGGWSGQTWDVPLSRKTPRRPYSVLLPVGFAVPLPLPAARCALTAPFHPCRPKAGGLLLCGTFPGVAPAGRYPTPFVRGARTFLPAGLSALAGAAVRPTDSLTLGLRPARVKVRRPAAPSLG